MSFFSDIYKNFRLPRVSETFRKSGVAVADFLLRGEDEEQKVRRGVTGMVKAILASENGEISNAHWTILRDLSDQFSLSESISLLNEIQDAAILTPKAAAELLADAPAEEKDKIMLFLLALSQADDVPDDRLLLVEKLAKDLGFSQQAVASMLDLVIEKKNKRIKLLRSGAGVAIVLGIIVIFWLLATWLRPVAFGLIAAFLLLPLEKFFERRLRQKRGFGYRVFGLLGIVFLPLKKLASKIKRRLHKSHETTPQEREKENECRIIRGAVMETMVVVLIVALLITLFFSNLVLSQLSGAGKAIGEWLLTSAEVSDGATEASTLASTTNYLNRAAADLSTMPPAQILREAVSGVLEDPQQRREILQILLQKSGGAFSLTAGVIGTVAGGFFDLLLSFFFGIFFLAKIADFCRQDESAGKQGEYLVRMLYNGKWLPGAQESTISEATRLTGGILVRLRIWVRGYLSLIMIDMIVYTTLFGMLGLKHFPLLGVIAGCSQLLPYLGPILTAAIALIVTFACGGTGTQLVLIVLVYLIYNGIIEQFIIYPAIIGDSLGLTTLETIIVVLLGAVLAGIPGMILAMPMASVAKYLVPQIYRCWEIRRRPSVHDNVELEDREA